MLKQQHNFKSAAIGGILTLTLAATVSCGDLAPEPADELIDLTLGKADGATLRSMSLTLAAGTTKRYRVKATGFSAALVQTGAPVQATLSAKHYSYDLAGSTGVAPTVEAKADGTIRNWTLRVINLGASPLTGTVTVTALSAPATTPELGIVSDIDKTVLPKHTDAEIDALLAAQTPPTPPTPPTTQPFHGNTSSKTFHAPTCRYYHCSSCSVSFTTRDAAIAAGYRPCGVCKP